MPASSSDPPVASAPADPSACGQLAASIAPTGTLRAAINLGNPVLAQGTAADPGGVTVDLARAIAERLGLAVEFGCHTAARDSFDALRSGDADLAFLADEPARAEQVSFTAPYVVIDGVFVVPAESPIRTVDDVDRPGLRVGVKSGSAYDLFLTRTLDGAEDVRGSEGVQVFEELGLEAAAGIRQPVTRYAASRPGVRVIEERFMQIKQAVALPKQSQPAAVAFVRDLVEELKANGFVADALRQSGQADAQVAPAG